MGTLPVLAALVTLLSAAPPKSAAALAYPEALASLAADRAALASAYQRAKKPQQRAAVLARARARLLEAFDQDLLPAWYGTTWEFYGMSEAPGEGAIACGYLVSTVLRDAGLRVERIRMAQQASEYIVRSLALPEKVLRFSDQTNAQVVEGVRAHGDGLYVVGLDYHVGFLRLDGPEARFCHSSYLGTRVVVCEDAAESPGMRSSLHVVGDALPDARVLDWLLQRPVPTKVKRPA